MTGVSGLGGGGQGVYTSPETATDTVITHPTGMHSCLL